MALQRLLLGALYAGGVVLAASQCETLKPKSNPQVADGVQFKLLLNDLSRPRGVIADSKGNLLVVEAGGKGIRRVELDDGEGLDTCVKSSAQLVSDNSVSEMHPEMKPLTFIRTFAVTALRANQVPRFGSSTMVSPSPRMAKRSSRRLQQMFMPTTTMPRREPLATPRI